MYKDLSKRLGIGNEKGNLLLFILFVVIVGAICTYGQGYLSNITRWINNLGKRGFFLIAFVEISAIVNCSFRIKDKVEHPFLLNIFLLIVILFCIDSIRISGIDKAPNFWAALILSVIWLIVNIAIVKRQRENDGSIRMAESKSCTLLRDAPTYKDDYKRRGLVRYLFQSIKEDSERPPSEIRGAFTFNIDEEYGRGKSSFFMMFKEELELNKCLHFDFLPWRSPSSASMVNTFFVELEKVLSPFVYLHTIQYIRKYAAIAVENVVQEQGLNLSALLDELKHFQTDYYNEIADSLKKIRRPIVVMVDDVDRLRKDELLALLCLIRNTADFPYLYFVLASDKEYIINTLSLSLQEKQDIEFYLQKIINMHILFPSVDDKNISDEILNLLSETLTSKGLSGEMVEKSLMIFRVRMCWKQV